VLTLKVTERRHTLDEEGPELPWTAELKPCLRLASLWQSGMCLAIVELGVCSDAGQSSDLIELLDFIGSPEAVSMARGSGPKLLSGTGELWSLFSAVA
jgi:hypothetical protein